MENRQINFFKSKDFNTVLKPFKKGTVVKIDSFDIRENKKDLNIGLFGWYAICLLYTSPSPRDVEESRMPSSA